MNKEWGRELEDRNDRTGALSHSARTSSNGDITSTILRYLRSTSKRDFVIIPIIILIEQAISRRRLRFWGAPLMIWGYAQYRLAGEYRNRVGHGGPGVSGPPPEHLVTSGIYRVTRNPMYTGHIIYLAEGRNLHRLSLIAGTDSYCTVLRSGTVMCWGDNSYGQLGAGSKADSSPVPVLVKKLQLAHH